jgi:hypothetical protein
MASACTNVGGVRVALTNLASSSHSLHHLGNSLCGIVNIGIP